MKRAIYEHGDRRARGRWTWATASVVLVVLFAWAMVLPRAEGQLGSILNSPHNLSAAGPGAVRAASEGEVCVFCHTPHNAAPIQPLWNRNVPVSAYRPYSSNSLQAAPGQPTGSSKLCLSCHDGTIALGSVLSRGQPIAMAGGITTLPPGHSNLGTDLSDDHPISFRYDSALTQRDPHIKDPALLPTAVRLDRNRELQCTTCHNPHDNSYGKFLVMDNANSQLCNACHQRGPTTVTGHAQCAACHQPHTAPSGPYLLRQATPTDTCLACHNGQPGTLGANIAADLAKFSKHDTRSPANLPNPIPNAVTCHDCHEAHTMTKTTALAPGIWGNFGRVSGMNISGAAIPQSSYEYEVCFKCHAENRPASVTESISRVIVQMNTRLEFSPSAASFHPVAAPGRNTNVPSLKPGFTTASIIYCSDCHASDTGKSAGGAGPSGTHGSNYKPLLIGRYDTADNSAESAAAYALCYRCHDRSSILGNRSFRYHLRHIQEERTPCVTCHDAHGISSTQGNTTTNAHLINFRTAVVRPVSGQAAPIYRSTGVFHGSCTLVCHGKTHNNLSY